MITTHLTVDIEPAISAPKALLYFSAPWCAPCSMLAPIVEKFIINNPDILVIKIDVEEKRDLARLYGIRGVPTIIALEYGAELVRHTGTADEQKLNQLFIK